MRVYVNICTRKSVRVRVTVHSGVRKCGDKIFPGGQDGRKCLRAKSKFVYRKKISSLLALDGSLVCSAYNHNLILLVNTALYSIEKQFSLIILKFKFPTSL